MARAGQPQMRSLPASHLAYEQQLRSAMPLARWFQPATATQAAGPWHAATIQLVEIDALLAYQFTVDTDRTTGHCGGLSSPPTLDELLAACLPTSWTTGPTPMSQQKTEPGPGLPPVNQSFVLKSRTLNFRILEQGLFPQPDIGGTLIGVLVGPALPHAQVVRFNNRCYLHNGFHRAVGARSRGATEIPCLVYDIPSATAAGIRDGATFPLTLLESANPPTVGHFTQGRAHQVRLRAMTRILQIHWADHVMPDED